MTDILCIECTFNFDLHFDILFVLCPMSFNIEKLSYQEFGSIPLICTYKQDHGIRQVWLTELETEAVVGSFMLFELIFVSSSSLNVETEKIDVEKKSSESLEQNKS